MRKILIISFLFIFSLAKSQTYIEYISEPSDSMALISKTDIDLINNVFNEKDVLDSLHNLNEQIISVLEQEIYTKDSVIINKDLLLHNKEIIITELENKNNKILDTYDKKLRQEKTRTTSFQALTGAGIIVIILLILL